MNELLTVTLIILVLTLNLIPFFIALTTLFPARTAKTQEIANRMPGRSFAIGLVNFMFLLLIALALFSLSEQVGGLLRGILLLPALFLTILLSIALSFGLGSMGQLIGERLAPAQSAWKRTFWGALLLGLGGSVPLLGWFLLLPYAAWVGMGAFIIGFFQKTGS
jgi:hypothetical protein